MSSLKKITPLLLITCLGAVSCNNSETNSDLANKTRTIQNDKNSTGSDNSKKIEYQIKKSDLLVELEALMDEELRSQYPKAAATIRSAADPRFYDIVIDLDKDVLPTEVEWEGSGYSFASCVKDYFDTNPDGCLTITHSDGTYSAESGGC